MKEKENEREKSKHKAKDGKKNDPLPFQKPKNSCIYFHFAKLNKAYFLFIRLSDKASSKKERKQGMKSKLKFFMKPSKILKLMPSK
jgi:hypothetical protein